MSKGIGIIAHKISEDEKSVIYEYGNYNLNIPEYRNENHVFDGTITIQKDCFAEPEIHEKVKKMPSGKKKTIVKRIPVDVHYGDMLYDGRIVVENCSNCWMVTDDELKIDKMVFHFLFYVFLRYQEQGEIPEKIGYEV